MELTRNQLHIYNSEIIVGKASSNVFGWLLVDKTYNLDWLKKQVNRMYELNDAFRFCLVKENGVVQQKVVPFSPRDVKVFYFDTKEEMREFAVKYAEEPLTCDPYLCEISLIILPERCGILPKLSHLISDAWTIALVGSQFNSLVKGETPITYSYKEHIEQEHAYLSSKRCLRDEEFFVSNLNEFSDCFVSSQTQATNYKTERKTFLLSEAEISDLQGIASINETSLFNIFLAIVSTYFNRVNGFTDKFCIGTTFLNRTGSVEKNTIGFFVNMLPVFISLDSQESFSKNLDRVKDALLCSMKHSKYNLQDALQKSNCNTEKPFDVVINYQNAYIVGDAWESEWINPGSNLYGLQISFEDRDNVGKLKIHYDYQIEKYDENEITAIHNRIMAIISDVIDNPEKPLYELDFLAEDEKEQINSFNNTEHIYDIPESTTLYSLFEEKSEENKDKVCIIANDKEITFGDFKAFAERIDNKVRSVTNEEKSVIAVICERSFEMYGAVYGIIRGGNAYLPIDPNYPQERIDYILENSGAKTVIAQDKFCHLVKNVPCINATDVLKSTEQPEKTPILANENDTAYVIYTSGSTGNPKGAKISHKSAVNRILWMHDFYPLEENDVILQKTPYTFDVSVWELFWWGMTGRTLCASKPDEHFLPAKILEETEKNKVTHLHFVPSVFDLFLTYLENNPQEQSKFESVKYVFLSGEALTANSINRFYNIYDYNKVSLHNLYGPTECAVDVSYYPCVPTDVDPVPIGKPIYNTQLHIVDKYLNPTPIGVTGELCIAGVNVGQGYLNNETLTNEKFIDNPFGNGKLYKTGDLAYWRNDGQICYVGRNDFQVKINGQRIELGEIENAIANVDGVVQCAVIVREQYICAFYTGKEIDTRELRSVLSTRLPRYMVPHVFTYMEEMPMTVSGKLDRKSLPEIDFSNVNTEAEYVEAETEEEKALAEAIEEVLNTEKVSMEDNFFNVGGDSITAIYVVSALEEKGYELHVADVMQSDTLSDVAKAMKSTSSKAIYDQYEVNGFVPFSPIMKAFLNEEKEIPEEFIHTCIVPVDCEEETVRKAMNILVSHHDMLRGTFTEDGIEILPSDDREVCSFNSITIEDKDEATEYLKNTRLQDDKLVNVVFCKTEKESLVSITVHHFLIDLVSWEVLLKDFSTVINQLKKDEKITLPAKTASFKLWSEKLREYSERSENKEYWNDINKQLDKACSIGTNEENEAEKYTIEFDKETSDKLVNEVNSKYGTRTNEVLLTALGLAAGKLADGTVGIMVESHGRAELHKPIAVERTIGWFTSCYPVVIKNNDNLAEELINVKETMRRIPKNGIEYLLINEKFHKNTDILFNFYKTSVEEDGISFGGVSLYPGTVNVNCFAIDGKVTVNIEVPKCKHKPQICEELGLEFVKQIENIIDACTKTEAVVKTRSDFSDDTLTQNELDELMDLFD